MKLPNKATGEIIDVDVHRFNSVALEFIWYCNSHNLDHSKFECKACNIVDDDEEFYWCGLDFWVKQWGHSGAEDFEYERS